MNRFWSKVDTSKECWEWKASKQPHRGYGWFYWKGRMQVAHRVSYELCTGKDPKELYVCHTCDNPGCVNPGHLFLGTQEDNMKDMKSKGRMYDRKGSRNPKASLTQLDVKVIRDLLKSGSLTNKQIGSKFGVSESTISNIKVGKTWSDYVS